MKIRLLVCSLIYLAGSFCYGQNYANGSITASGSTCATAGACVVAQLQQNSGGATITLSGTWSATVQFEAAADGVNFSALSMTPVGGGSAVTSATGNGVWQVNIAGLSVVRARASALASGTAVVNIQGSTASARTGGSGGGSGTVTSVSGTTNEVNVANPTTTPVISLSGSLYSIPNSASGNTFLGLNAGNTTATGTNDTVIGNGAGLALTVPAMGATPQAATFFGYGAGASCTTCRESTLIGYNAGNALVGNGAGIQDGLDTMIGSQAGVFDDGIDETFIGIKAGAGMQGNDTLDQDNVMVGVHAGVGWYSGKWNFFLGNEANDGGNGETGNGNIGIGFSVLQATCASTPTCGGGSYAKNYNIGIGQFALEHETTQDYQLAIGFGALENCTTCSNMTVLGSNAGLNTVTDSDDTFIGNNAGNGVIGGSDDTYVGYNSGQNYNASGSGSSNTFVGSNSGDNITSGSNNVLVGVNADRDITTGQRNVYIGESAAYAATTDSYNVVIGDSAGNAMNTSSGGNVFAGYQAGQTCTTCTNSIGVGYQAKIGATASNAVQIGPGTNSTNNTMQLQSYNFLNLYGPKLNQYCITGTGCAAGVTLPSAATAGAGTVVMVLDATTFAVGTCTGGGSDAMLAVSDGTNWSCH